MPEEEPLQSFAALELIGEAQHVVLVRKLEEVQELRAGLHDREGR